MQTFLPYEDFEKTAKVLDYRRLGKQRVESLTMLKGKWPNHPANKMWGGHEYWHCKYALVICDEWISRGYKDTCKRKIQELQKLFEDTGPPCWLGDSKFHLSHQSNLIRKDPKFYKPLFPGVPDNLEYVWPRVNT